MMDLDLGEPPWIRLPWILGKKLDANKYTETSARKKMHVEKREEEYEQLLQIEKMKGETAATQQGCRAPVRPLLLDARPLPELLEYPGDIPTFISWKKTYK